MLEYALPAVCLGHLDLFLEKLRAGEVSEDEAPRPGIDLLRECPEMCVSLSYIHFKLAAASTSHARSAIRRAVLTDPLPPCSPSSAQARARASRGNGTPPHSAARELPPVRRRSRRGAPRSPTYRVRSESRRGTVERESAARRIERQRRCERVRAALATTAAHVG